MGEIRLGYQIGSGEPITTNLKHAVFTGVTESGKTTAIEGCIRQEIEQGKTGLVFLTKKGEEEFTNGNQIQPYFKDDPTGNNAMWEYVQDILEATMSKSMGYKESQIIDAVETEPYPELEKAETLREVWENVQYLLQKDMEEDNDINLSGIPRSIYTSLDKYFEKIVPRIEEANFSQELEMQEGKLNIMDLRDFGQDLQSMIIERCLMKIYRDYTDVRVGIPEAWKFVPQQSSSICKEAVAQFAREGGTNDNYLAIDAQDMTRVDKEPLKQMKQWILGLQTEKNEVERTRDQMPVLKKNAPSKEEIMSLAIGHFYYCEATPGAKKAIVEKFYVKPAWMDDIEWEGLSGDELAISIAKGETDVAPLVKAIDEGELDIGTKKVEEENNPVQNKEEISEEVEDETVKKYKNRAENLEEKNKFLKKEIDELETELENKEEEIDDLEQRIQRLEDNVDTGEEDDSAPKDSVLQAVNGEEEQDKNKDSEDSDNLDEELEELRHEILGREEVADIVNRVVDEKNLAKKTYVQEQVQNIEAGGKPTNYAENIQDEILQDFQEETIEMIMSKIDDYTGRQKKMLLWLEARGKNVNSFSKWYRNSLNVSGNPGTAVKEYREEIVNDGFVRKDKGNNYHPETRKMIKERLEEQGASEEQIEETYNKVLAKLKKQVDE